MSITIGIYHFVYSFSKSWLIKTACNDLSPLVRFWNSWAPCSHVFRNEMVDISSSPYRKCLLWRHKIFIDPKPFDTSYERLLIGDLMTEVFKFDFWNVSLLCTRLWIWDKTEIIIEIIIESRDFLLTWQSCFTRP